MGKRKPKLLFEAYVEDLVKELGPHYKYDHYGSAQWLGFIYCECYHGKDFYAWPPAWAEGQPGGGRTSDEYTPPPPMLLPGAVARIEYDKAVILDLSQDHYKNGNPKPHNRKGGHNSDSVVIRIANPNFNEDFLMQIKLIHDKNTEYFGIKNVYGRSDGVR